MYHEEYVNIMIDLVNLDSWVQFCFPWSLSLLVRDIIRLRGR